MAATGLLLGCGGTIIDAFPPIDVPAGDDAGPGSDVVAPSDISTGFCAVVRCASGTRCCEAEMRCVPEGTRCGGDPPPVDGGVVVDASPGGCTSSRECGGGNECVFPVTGCSRTGVCMAGIACLRAETFCSCAGETFMGCRPDRPTRSVGACGGTDGGVVDTGFCAVVRCASGTRCCEALRMCIATTASCPTDPPPVDGGTSCRSNSDCGRGQYCAGTGCGTAGSCQARPEVCPDLYSPVCGCDGRTYSNECEASGAGVRVMSRGMCPTVIDAGVDAGSFCASAICPTGMRCCEARRTCQPAGVSCPIDPPVDAGVDVTPIDAGSFCAAVLCAPGTRCCEALRACQPAGVLCPTDPPVDAGVDAGPVACRSNGDCRTGQYCAGTTCDGAGTCAARPEACTLEYNPVCGCNGTTYGNACAAASAGVRVASRGECARVDAGVDTGTATCTSDRDCGAGQSCCSGTGRCYASACLGCCMFTVDAGTDAGTGCRSATDCRSGQECVFPTTGCATAGTCMGAIACLRPETFCSCTGATYLSCRPNQSTRALGACGSSVDAGTVDAGSTACRSNSQCATGQYCAGSGCDTAGTCATRPDACATIYSPVCGCNRLTYPNECSAAAAGVRVVSRGVCP